MFDPEPIPIEYLTEPNEIDFEPEHKALICIVCDDELIDLKQRSPIKTGPHYDTLFYCPQCDTSYNVAGRVISVGNDY